MAVSNAQNTQNGQATSTDISDIRSTLIHYFSDNATPTGDQFRAFIEAVIIQGSDPLTVEGDTLIVSGAINSEQALTIGGASVLSAEGVSVDSGAATLNAQELKVGDALLLDDSGLTVTNGVTVGATAKVEGRLIVNGEEFSGDEKLRVTGHSNLDGDLHLSGEGHIEGDLLVQSDQTIQGELNVNNHLNVGTQDTAGVMHIHHQGETTGLLVESHEGNNRRTTQMCLDHDGRLSLGLDEGQAEAKLHIYHSGSNSDAIFQVDDSASDTRPFIIKGDGRVGIATKTPENELDVDGSVRIGSSASAITKPNSLSVEGCVGLGTVNPEAKLDLRAAEQERALQVCYGDQTPFSIQKGTVTIDGYTALQVEGVSTFNQAIHANAESILNQSVHVNALFNANDIATFSAQANFDDKLCVKGLSELSDVMVSEKATFNKQVIVKGDAKYGQSLAIGLGTDDNHNASAALHIKQGSQPALRIDSAASENLLKVDGNTIELGSDNAEAHLSVKGDVSIIGDVDVHGRGLFDDGVEVEQSLSVRQTDPAQLKPAVHIHAELDTAIALQVSQVLEGAEQSVFTVTQNKVGILCDVPEADLHVAGRVRVDGVTDLNGDVGILGKLRAQSPAILEQNLNVGFTDPGFEPSGARLHVAMEPNGPTLKLEGTLADSPVMTVQGDYVGIHNEAPDCALDVHGDANIQGRFNVNALMDVDEYTLKLHQQEQSPALHILGTGEAPGVMLNADSIGINVNRPEADLHLFGSSKLDGASSIRQLTVEETLLSRGSSQFLSSVDIQGPVMLNGDTVDPNIDLHITQSKLQQVALRVDPSQGETPALLVTAGTDHGYVGINTDSPTKSLDVQGSALVSESLCVEEDLHVTGETTSSGNNIVHGNIGLSVEVPKARLHIHDEGAEETALRIDSQFRGENSSLVFKHGMLGVGIRKPTVQLDVKGDANVSDELTVMGQTKLEHTLYVDKDALFKSDLTVNKDSEFVGQTVLGKVNDIDPELTPNSQLYIADTRYKEALRIDSADFDSLVFTQGKLGIGKTDPRVSLDIEGECRITQAVELKSTLEVNDVLRARDNIEGYGSLHISHKATFGSDMVIRGDLSVEDNVVIEDALTVTGSTQLHTLDVKTDTTLEGQLDVSEQAMFMKNVDIAGPLNVSSDAQLDSGLSVGASMTVAGDVTAANLHVKQDLHVTGAIHTGVSNPQAFFHLRSPETDTAFILDKRHNNNSPERLLTVDNQGRMGIGITSPSESLDVEGSARISAHLSAQSCTLEAGLSTGDVNINGSLTLASGPTILAVSEDSLLGGEDSINSVLPTQAAVKAYVDKVAVPFGRSGRTYTITSQQEFDAVFNQSNNTVIAENTTVILLPAGNHTPQDYKLNNTVTLRSGVSIKGFNQATTRIVKQNVSARFEIIGVANQPVKNVSLSGFTFDGNQLQTANDGGAFYLEHVSDCQLNCKIQNHITWGNGGGLFAPMSRSGEPTVSRIEALHIHYCKAMDQGLGTDVQVNEGGAAYGLYRSTIGAYHCEAERGGAVAHCHGSTVHATACKASRDGGGAYRCEQLSLTALDCVADMANGKGGAAYYCSDMICMGQWMGNNAAEAPHIYASNHLTGADEERHYWKGDYIGRRIDDDVSIWRAHNE